MTAHLYLPAVARAYAKTLYKALKPKVAILPRRLLMETLIWSHPKEPSTFRRMANGCSLPVIFQVKASATSIFTCHTTLPRAGVNLLTWVLMLTLNSGKAAP